MTPLVTSLPTLPLPPYQSPDPQPSPSPLHITSGAINTLFEAQLGLFESPVVFITLKAFFWDSKIRIKTKDGDHFLGHLPQGITSEYFKGHCFLEEGELTPAQICFFQQIIDPKRVNLILI